MSAPESWEDMDPNASRQPQQPRAPYQQQQQYTYQQQQQQQQAELQYQYQQQQQTQSGFRFSAQAPVFSFNPSASTYNPSAAPQYSYPTASPYVPPGQQYGYQQPYYQNQSVAQSSQPYRPRAQPQPQPHPQAQIAPSVTSNPVSSQTRGPARVIRLGGDPPKVESRSIQTPVPATEDKKEPAVSETAGDDWEKKESEEGAAVGNGVPGEGKDGISDKLAAVNLVDSSTTKDPPSTKGSKSAEVVEDHVEEEEELEHEEEDGDSRDHLNVVFIGHVDAGKSTIGGQILYLSGMVDKRTIEKFEREAKEKNRESWYMAYIMDTNEEERAKGKTVEVGRAHFETAKRRYTVLDAPGHKNYVPNMISGASQADVGVLVISSRKGEFETGFERGGQTREHAQLAKTLGVSKMVVVVNKMDDPSVEWAKERFDEIVTKMTPFLKQCGYNTKKDVNFLPISGLMGSNMKERMTKDVCSWWDGPSFFESLDSLELPERDPKGPFRMPLIDRYRDMGTVVMGKIESGSVRRGASLLVMPNKTRVKVVTLFRDNDEVKYARPGENLRIRLSGVEEEDISSGFVLSSIRNPITAVLEFEAQLQILELLDHKGIFTAGYKAVLHLHSVVEECEIIDLLKQMDMKTKQWVKKKPLFVKSNAIVMARIQVAQIICVERFADFPQLGRFTLRDEGKTVAIGKVMKLITPQN